MLHLLRRKGYKDIRLLTDYTKEKPSYNNIISSIKKIIITNSIN